MALFFVYMSLPPRLRVPYTLLTWIKLVMRWPICWRGQEWTATWDVPSELNILWGNLWIVVSLNYNTKINYIESCFFTGWVDGDLKLLCFVCILNYWKSIYKYNITVFDSKLITTIPSRDSWAFSRKLKLCA